MKKGLRFSLILTCLLLMMASKASFAQLPQTIEFGPHAGISTYQGDLNPWKFFNEFGYNVGGLVRFNYDTRWSFRADYTHATVKATDSIAGWRPERKLNFRTTVNDLSFIAEFNFLDYYTGRRESAISPYLFAGISVFSYDVHTHTGLEAVDTLLLFPEFDEGRLPVDDRFTAESLFKMKDGGLLYFQRHLFSASIPFGFGCKFSLTQHLAATTEWRMHYTFTDFLDGVHGVYPDGNHTVVGGYDMTDPSGNYHAGEQRGDSSTNDWFGVLTFSVTWKIPIPGSSACKILY